MTNNEAMQASIERQLASNDGVCAVQLGETWDALHDAIWTLKRLAKLHITNYNETANIVSIAAGTRA